MLSFKFISEVPSAPITIGITTTVIFYNFYISPTRSWYFFQSLAHVTFLIYNNKAWSSCFNAIICLLEKSCNVISYNYPWLFFIPLQFDADARLVAYFWIAFLPNPVTSLFIHFPCEPSDIPRRYGSPSHWVAQIQYLISSYALLIILFTAFVLKI